MITHPTDRFSLTPASCATNLTSEGSHFRQAERQAHEQASRGQGFRWRCDCQICDYAYLLRNGRTITYPKLRTATRMNNTYSSSHGQTSVDPLQLAFANLEPDAVPAVVAVAPASGPPEEGPGGPTEAVAAPASRDPTEVPEASAASAPQLLPRVGDTFGDWSTNAGGDDGGGGNDCCGGGAVERFSGLSLGRGSRPPWLHASKSLSLGGGFGW